MCAVDFTEFRMRKQALEFVAALKLRLEEGTDPFTFIHKLLQKQDADYLLVKDSASGNMFRIPFDKSLLSEYVELIDWVMTRKAESPSDPAA